MSSECPPFATKEEFEELKQQINTLFGKTEDGSGQIDVLKAGTLQGTAISSLLVLAGTAIQKIVLEGDVGGNIATKLASGAAKFEAVRGNGTKAILTGLNNVGKAVGKNVDKLKIASSGIGANAQALGVALSLVSQGLSTGLQIGTLNLIKQNTANNEFNFNALARDYSSMINFISQNKIDIIQAQATNETNKVLIQEQTDINSDQYSQLLKAQAHIATLENVNQKQNAEITKANGTITNYKAQIEAYQDDVDNFKEEMEFQIIELESALLKSEGINGVQTETIATLKTDIEAQDEKFKAFEKQMLSISLTNTLWRHELIDLREDLIEDRELLDVKIKLLDAKIILAESKTRNGAAAGGTGVAVGAATKAQNGIIDLAESLVGVPVIAPPLTNDDTYNRTNTFDNTLTDLIAQIREGGVVNEQQQNALREGINLDMQTLIPALLGTTLIPTVNTVAKQTTPAAISSAAATGLCSTAAPGGCMQQNITQPLQNQIGQMINAGGTAFSAANFGILNQMQPVLNGVNNTVNVIKGITNTTLGIVSHATHGLQATKSFLDKAWKSTQADKILNGITTAVVIHNAIQLSGNLAATIGETASIALDAIGIRDEKLNPIDVNGIVKAKMTSLISTFIGAENYEALTQRLAKYNRIYQAGANVFDATRDLLDSARSTAELTAENTGKIGNALLESGVVYENSYSEMIDKVNPQSRAMQRLDRFREKLETIEDGVSTVSEISSGVVETKDNFEQLKEAKKDWKAENEKQQQEKKEEKEEVKQESEVTAEIEAIDFTKDESEE